MDARKWHDDVIVLNSGAETSSVKVAGGHADCYCSCSLCDAGDWLWLCNILTNRRREQFDCIELGYWPALVADHPIVACSRVSCLQRPEKVRSSGCRRWVHWGGNVSITTPLSRAKRMTARDLWLSWLSRNSRWRFSFVPVAVSTNSFIHLRKRLPSMYPEPRTFTVPIDPTGHPCIKWSTNRFLGKTKSGGTNIPPTLMQHSAVMFCPRSALDTFLTWAIPVVANTFTTGFATTENPVSPQFHVRTAVKSPSVSTSLYFCW